jgi:hypothetical protein
LLLAGCRLGSSYFVCARDAECVLAGDHGWCEPSGYCAFADSSCDGGRRYGQWAPAPLGSACVVVGGDLGGPDLALADGGACGGDLQPCCGGTTCDDGRVCGNGTCFLFYDGFDGTIAPSWTLTQEHNSSLAADGSRAFRGAGSLKVTASAGAASWELVYLSRPSSQSPLYARAFFWIPSTATLSTTSDAQLMGYLDSNDAPYPSAGVSLSSSFRLGVYVNNWSATPASATAATAMPLDTWVCVEWSVRWDASPSVSLSAMGAPIASLTPAPLASPLDLSFIGFAGPPPLAPLSFWIDELALDEHPIGCAR